MRRLFWLTMGATAGVLIVRQLSKAARTMTPEGAADKATNAANNLADAVRVFAEDVKAGMADRDHELRDALGIGDDNGGQSPDAQVVEYLLQAQRQGQPRQ